MGKFVVFEIEGSRYAVRIDKIQRIEPYSPDKNISAGNDADAREEISLVNFSPSRKLLEQTPEKINILYLDIGGETYAMPVPRKLDIAEIEKFSQNSLLKKISIYFGKVGLVKGKPVLILDVKRLSGG
ncbi:chemotaxis protein CheW [bacterium]|nr:chemotaxis protein CheW [bacterium]